MEILVQLSPGNGNPRWPDRLGDGAKVTVEFPFTEDFYEIVSAIHDQAFKIHVDEENFDCVLNQGGTPIAMIFPDAQASPPIISMKLMVYCSVEDILKIKKAQIIKLVI